MDIIGPVPVVVRRVWPWVAAAVVPAALAAVVAIGAHNPFPHARYLLPLLVVLLPVPLLLRRPLPALGLMLVGLVVVAGTAAGSWEWGYQRDLRLMHVVAIDVAVGVLAAIRPARSALPAAAVALGAQVAVFARFRLPAQGLDVAIALATLAMVAACAVGILIRERAAHAVALREQAAAQAVTAERLRIAREVHDMVAHHISVIAIQAGVGSRVIATRPDEARRALDAIETTSRETLAGLRRTVTGLRAAPISAAAVPGPHAGAGADAVSYAPAPGLHELAGLASSTRAAGVDVAITRRGDERPLPAEIDLSAFRVVQEAVTNVVRHAGVPACRVRVTYRPREVTVEVSDDGVGGAPEHPGAGFGLVGLRERVTLLGGHFEAGPRSDCGFHVAASFPTADGPREGDRG